MKKYIFLLILLLIMFISFRVKAETCDTDKISISSITLEEKTDTVDELSEANVDGKNINLNLSMSDVGDNAKYKLIINNESNEDYELDSNSLKINTEYVDYSFEFEDSSNLLKANSRKIVFLRVEYKNEVPEDQFESMVHNDNKTITMQLSTNGKTISIPDTSKNSNLIYIILILILLLIIGISLILLNNKRTKIMILIVGTILLIPISALGACKCELKINSNIKIVNKFTGTIYRADKFKVKNDTNVMDYNKYLYIDDISQYGPYYEIFDTLEECEDWNYDGIGRCEIRESLLDIDHYKQDDTEFIERRWYLRHDIEDNIIKSTYVCIVYDGEKQCIKGADPEAYSDNLQIILDYISRSSCRGSEKEDGVYCNGAYDMEVFVLKSGYISINLAANHTCYILEDGASYCR